MKNKLVRQAVATALNKNAIVQIFGGSRIAAPANQIVLPGNVGYIQNYNPYPNNGGSGDPAKAKALLTKAGFPSGVAIKLLYATTDPAPRIAQSIQSSLGTAGFKVTIVPTTGSDFYGKYLTQRAPPSAALGHRRAGLDPGLVRQQRQVGHCSRSVTSPGPGASDYTGYDSPVTNELINQALTASHRPSRPALEKGEHPDHEDAAIVPIELQKWPSTTPRRCRVATSSSSTLSCDPTNVWLKG